MGTAALAIGIGLLGLAAPIASGRVKIRSRVRSERVQAVLFAACGVLLIFSGLVILL